MVIIINAIENLLYARHHPKPFMKIISFNSYNYSRKYLHLTERNFTLQIKKIKSNLPQLTQLDIPSDSLDSHN